MLSSPVQRLNSPDHTPLLPSYYSSTTLPPAYATHRADRLLLLPPQPPSRQPSQQQEQNQDQNSQLFSITAQIRFKIHNPLQLLQRFLILFLLLNTALFALLVYNLDETAVVSRVRAEDGICPCPLTGASDGCYESLNNESLLAVMEGIGREEYEKLEVWRMCIAEVRGVKEWREWVLWVLMPGMCITETVAAWAWWWCLGEKEEEVEVTVEQEQQDNGDDEEDWEGMGEKREVV